MAKTVKFIKDDKINSAEYKIDEELKVSDELAVKLEAKGSVKLVKATSKTKES